MKKSRLFLEIFWRVLYCAAFLGLGFASIFYHSSDVHTLLGTANIIIGVGVSLGVFSLLFHSIQPSDKTKKFYGYSKMVASCLFAIYWVILLSVLTVYYKSDNSVFFMLGVFLCLVKIVLSCFSENDWSNPIPPKVWQIVRNVPLFGIGCLAILSSLVFSYDFGFSSIFGFLWLIAVCEFSFFFLFLFFQNRNKHLSNCFLFLVSFFALLFAALGILV